MKTLLALFFALSAVCIAADPAVEDLSKAPTVHLVDLGKSENGSIIDKIVKVKFGWRDGNSIAATNGKSKGRGFASSKLVVVVPEAGKAWFDKLPTRENSPAVITAYVKVNSSGPTELVAREYRNGQPVW